MAKCARSHLGVDGPFLCKRLERRYPAHQLIVREIETIDRPLLTKMRVVVDPPLELHATRPGPNAMGKVGEGLASILPRFRALVVIKKVDRQKSRAKSAPLVIGPVHLQVEIDVLFVADDVSEDCEGPAVIEVHPRPDQRPIVAAVEVFLSFVKEGEEERVLESNGFS